MSEYYRVKLQGRDVTYVEADGKPGARKKALETLEIEKLKGGEVASLIAQGVIRHSVAPANPPSDDAE